MRGALIIWIAASLPVGMLIGRWLRDGVIALAASRDDRP